MDIVSHWLHLSHASGSQGAGTEDEVLIEILASRTGEQIKEITKVYKKGKTLHWWRGREKQTNMVTVTTTNNDASRRIH